MKQADLERELVRLRLMIEQSLDLICTANEEGAFEDVSGAAERILGYRPEEMAGQPLLKFIHPDDHAATAETAASLRTGGRTHDFRNRYIHKNGTVVLMSWSAIWSPEHRLAFAVGRDLTEWSEREERFRLSFENHPHPAWIYDKQDLLFLEVNESACRKYGYTKEDFLRMGVLDLVPAEVREGVRLRIAASPDHTRAGEWRHRTKDGRALIVEGWSHDISTRGRPARLAMAVDVSEKRALEDQFRQAQKMEAVGQLAGGLAHDFNNLLTIINGFAELGLTRVQESDSVCSYLQSIHDAGERAASLTRQLLTFSRRQIIQPKPIRLQQVVADVMPMLRRLVPETIDLRITLEHNAPETMADPAQIEQALMNLVINSRDALEGGGQISLELGRLDLRRKCAAQYSTAAGKCYSRLTVADTGSGMDAETRARIFEPFFTTKERGQGTGLGLPTVLGIVQQAGGHVLVESEVNVGTRVDLLFPALLDRDPIAPGRTKSKPALRGGSERILLVEDEEEVLAFTASILRELGYRVTEARSGAEALGAIDPEQPPFDLLLTDLMLPRMSGRKLIDLVRERIPAIKTLCVSGHAERDFLQGGVLDPSLPFIAKPYTRDSIGRKVREVLDTV